MSARLLQKVLRIPCGKCGVTDRWKFADTHESLFDYDLIPGFRVAPTEEQNIDYLLYERICPYMESFGTSRKLRNREKKRYRPIFRKLFPDVDMNDVRYLEYCWYDGTEAPDYYRE